MSIDAFYNEIEQARIAWADLYDLLVQGKYDVIGSRPAINGQPVEAIHRRAALVFEGLASLRPRDPESAQGFVLASKASEVRQTLKNFITHAQATVNLIRPQWQEGMTLRDTNGNFAMQLTQSDGGAITNFDPSGNFTQIDSSLNQLTTHLALLLPLCRAEGVDDLSQRATALGDVVRETGILRDQAKKMAEAAKASASSASERDKAAQALIVQAEAALAKLQAFQQQATTDTGAVSALVEQIKAIGASAGSLEKQITAYQSAYDAFQKQLDDRNTQFAQFQENDRLAREANIKRESEIDRLIKHADAMISGATTAGLADSLERTRKRYEERMNAARTGFKWSVAFLVVSALPLAAHLLPGLFGDLFPKVTEAAHSSWYGVLGKVLLLVPATWLTTFYNAAFANAFQLERDYAHKAALAMSVDGFKRQAEKYQEEITAEVFLEIRNNPGKGQAIEPAAHPLYDILAKVVGKALDKNKEDKKT